MLKPIYSKQKLKLAQHYTGVSINGIIEEIPITNIVHQSVMLRYKIRGISELSISIKKDGLLQTIIVRPINSSFEIVAGNRRFHAIKLLKWRKIPCHILELDNREAFEVSLILNVHRHTLDPIEEAHAFKKYVTDFGWGGISQLSRRLSKSPAYVCKRMKLLELPKNVLGLISTSDLHVSTAEDLLSIDDNNRQSQLVSIITERKISSKSVRTIIRNEMEELNPSELSQNRTNSDQETVLKAFDKSVISMKMAMFKLATVMEGFRQNYIIH